MGTYTKTASDTGYAIEELEEVGWRCPLDSVKTVRYLKTTWTLIILYLACQTRAAYVLGHPLAWLIMIELLILLPRIATACDMFSYHLFATKGKHRGRHRLTGGKAPKIDVIVTCCGEDVDVIMDSAMGAVLQDYPPHCFRVFILDDGQSSTLKKAVDQHNARNDIKEITYLARSKLDGLPHYFKAGNLAFGMAETHRRDAFEYLAALDADMIPEPDWLRRTVPHLILDPKLALVNPAQVRLPNILKILC
jgi:cellulose synthase/poly-beta-1,6-N-acetylglucosamine synthase-like glycosyltransferase